MQTRSMRSPSTSQHIMCSSLSFISSPKKVIMGQSAVNVGGTETDESVLDAILLETGLRDELVDATTPNQLHLRDDEPQQLLPQPWMTKQWTMALIAGGFASFNVIALLSLYPVLRGRGAPYLPTKTANLDAMFAQLRKNVAVSKTSHPRPTFVDLGSGDGRVVFRAARENFFSSCSGYEINPMLHGFAQLRRILTPKYWTTTQFGVRDIWKVDLSNVDVVAVYGLSPMMKDLGVKLKQELKPGSYVVSNVFAIPDWRPIDTSPHGTHIYRAPESWQQASRIPPPQS